MKSLFLALILIVGFAAGAQAHDGHGTDKTDWIQDQAQTVGAVGDVVSGTGTDDSCCHSGTACAPIGQALAPRGYETVSFPLTVRYHHRHRAHRPALAWQPPTPPPILAV